MALDTSIPLQVRGVKIDVPDPYERKTRALTLQNLGASAEMNRLQLEREQESLAKQKAVLAAIDAAGGDLEQALPQILRIDPMLVPQFQAFIDQQKNTRISRDVNARTAAIQNLELMEGATAPEVNVRNPVATPAPIGTLDGGTVQPPSQGGGTRNIDVPLPEHTIPGIPDLGVGSVKRRPRSVQELFRENAAKKRQELDAKLMEPYTLNAGDRRMVGDTVIAESPKTRNFQAKEIVGPDGKTPVMANFDPDEGKYYNPDTGQMIPNARPYERPQDPAIAALRDVQTQLARMQVEGMGLTPNQRANEINTLRSQWTRAVAPILDRRGAVAKIDSGLRALDQGNFRDSTQILITAFNKLLDEISVVREGEYARTSEGQALMDRIVGGLDQLQRGGTPLTRENLLELGRTAKELAQSVEAVHADELFNVRESIEKTLDDYKIPHDRVFGSSEIGRRAAPGGSGLEFDGFTFPNQEALDRYKRRTGQ